MILNHHWLTYLVYLFGTIVYEVVNLYYPDLKSLIQFSSSTRNYFLSLPIQTQILLHEQSFDIHCANDLHQQVQKLSIQKRQLENSNYYPFGS